MVRYTRFVTALVIALGALPGSLLAQAQPPVPVMPARPAMPAMPVIPAMPALPPMPPVPVFGFDAEELKAQIERMKEDKEFAKIDKELFKVDMDLWKADMEAFKEQMHDFKFDMPDLKFDLAFDYAQAPKPAPVPMPGPKGLIGRVDNNEDRNYQNGVRALDAGRWDEAVEYFTRVVTQNGSRADGAMYWIAWAQNKQGNGSAALTTLGKIPKESRWTTEAGALSVEIRQRANQP